jgi:channel protein (hemolysin III family)
LGEVPGATADQSSASAAARGWTGASGLFVLEGPIFMLIAGTYTPLALLALHGPLATATLVAVWAGALTGVLFKLVWIDAPTWRFAVAYIALGWVAVAAFPQLAVAIGVGGLTLFGLGGVLYTVLSRATSTALTTSAVVAHRAITAGWRSIIPLNTCRASS